MIKMQPLIARIAAGLACLIQLVLISPAWSQLTITGANQTGTVPLTPAWTRAADSLIAGLAPTVANGNFGEYTGANARHLTQPGVPLTIHAYATAAATNLAVAGNDGTAGSLLIYTLPARACGYDLTNITVYGGWQDAGRDAQDYTVSYSTVANPGIFIRLTSVNYIPANPGNTGDATRVVIHDPSGAVLARNVAALMFDFTAPDGGNRENHAAGYAGITVQGTAATSMVAPPIAGTVSNQQRGSSFTPTWPIETDSLIAGQLPSVGLGDGSFTAAAGAVGASALTDGAFGSVANRTAYATCGSVAGQSVTYHLGSAMITNIVVYSGWPDQSHDGQFYHVSYSTVSAPSTFLPLAGVYYNPAVTGFSANRSAINTPTGAPLATNVDFLKFDFTSQGSNTDNGYTGYAEIVVEGTNATPAQPSLGASPITEPYPYVSDGSFSGPPVPLSPDPLVAYRWPHPQAGDGLELYLQKPVTVTADTNAAFANLSSLTGETPKVTVNGAGSIQLDFGRENAAWLEFDSPDLTGSVEMSISEYNQPAITMVGGCAHYVKTLAPTKYGHTYRLELNRQLYEGVRFGWIHVRSFTAPWHITGIRLVCQSKPANYNGSFSCSDPLLTRIWYVGAYTVKLNLLDHEFGAILMDRGDRFSWTGDAHCSQAAALVAFANHDFIKQNLDISANDANGIESYSLYWVLSLIDYYNYTADAATLGGYITNAMTKLDHAYAVFGTHPGLGFYGWDERLGFGFQNANCPEAQHAYQMLSIRAWREFAATMGAYGRADLQAKYSDYANAKLADLRQHAAWYQSFGLHAAADAVDTGLLNPAEKSALFTQAFTDRVNRLSYSPFNQYFVIQALAAMDKYDDALSSIYDLWGSEIAYGGTTFFEVSRPSWNSALGPNDPLPNGKCGFTSLCHPWSAAVTKWLSEEVLGIKPTAPGFASYQIRPHLSRTLTYVAGKTATPFGDLQASFNVSNGLCTVAAPAGTVGTVGIPKVEKNIRTITINGTLAWDGAFHPVAGLGGASEDAEFVSFTGVQPGTYSVSVAYTGTTPVYTPPAEKYAARFIKTDAATSGNWGGVYGHAGYVLCNYRDNGSDQQSLPSYVSSVSYNLDGAEPPKPAMWAANTSDSRALAADATNPNTRNAAGLHTDGFLGGRNTMTCTINCTGTNEYQVALYFVDWEKLGRRLAVEMYDASTLDLVAPEKVVTDFAGGKYLVYTFNKSVKFRIDHVRGDNAVLSGIFFDPAPPTTAPAQPAREH